MKVRLDERGRLSPSTVSSSVAAMATMFSRVPSPVRARAAPRRAVRPGASSSRFSRFPRVAASADASPADASPRVVILGGGIQGVATSSLDCFGLNGYFFKLLFWLAVPIVGIVIVLIRSGPTTRL